MKLTKPLTERERFILAQRFWRYADMRRPTLRQLGERFGVTRERVRQIEADAVRKVCHQYGIPEDYNAVERWVMLNLREPKPL